MRGGGREVVQQVLRNRCNVDLIHDVNQVTRKIFSRMFEFLQFFNKSTLTFATRCKNIFEKKNPRSKVEAF